MNTHKMRYLLAVVAGLVCLIARPVLADDRPKDEQESQSKRFLRIQRSMEDQPLALQTSIVRYVPAEGEGETIVDLIGVVHIGDRAYYEKLNKQFETYDVLLYELVAAPEDRVPTREKVQAADGLLAAFQKLGPALLSLESQMDHVDYTKKNFVHADLSPTEMAKAIKERGDDPRTLFLSVVADLIRQGNLEKLREQKGAGDDDGDLKEAEELDPFALLMDPNGARKLKLVLAEQFVADADLNGGLGPTLGTILIEDRNKAAMKVFQKELAKGSKRIGIFYGAAHMPDFEKRLQNDFGLKRESVRWLTAWDLQRRGKGPAIDRILRALIE